jgi:predicted SAM-dependent methyltransferase
MVLVNIGCGSTWHPSWVNLDVRPMHQEIRRWDARKGLPFGASEVDACYSSHFLEHLSRRKAQALMQETRRVLRSGGTVRLAVPDLEALTREYLQVLGQADKGEEAGARRYEWITLELLDQLVRTESGGEMERYLRTGAHENRDYVVSRIGFGAQEYMERSGDHPNGRPICDQARSSGSLRHSISSMMIGLKRLFKSRQGCREEITIGLCGLLMGPRGMDAMREGLFRKSGETHRWMYDRFSLRQLLEQAGFAQIRLCTAFESGIPSFSSFGLDVVEGRVRKPDSLFMEAVKL